MTGIKKTIKECAGIAALSGVLGASFAAVPGKTADEKAMNSLAVSGLVKVGPSSVKPGEQKKDTSADGLSRTAYKLGSRILGKKPEGSK